jgi:hypothetical protein
MAKLTEADMKELFAELTAAMPDENEFNNVMIKNAEKFSLPIEIKLAFIDVGGNNTINHQIARATKKKVTECNANINDCSVCIDNGQKITGQDVGSAAYKLYEYINRNDKVKEKYRELFSESYKNTKNAKKYTPLDFAKSCKPEFAEFMTAEFVIPTPPVKLARSSFKKVKQVVVDAASKTRDSFSNLAAQVTSSKRRASAKENKPELESVKDEDLTVEQLKQKIEDLENKTTITHTIVGPVELHRPERKMRQNILKINCLILYNED